MGVWPSEFLDKFLISIFDDINQIDGIAWQYPWMGWTRQQQQHQHQHRSQWLLLAAIYSIFEYQLQIVKNNLFTGLYCCYYDYHYYYYRVQNIHRLCDTLYRFTWVDFNLFSGNFMALTFNSMFLYSIDDEGMKTKILIFFLSIQIDGKIFFHPFPFSSAANNLQFFVVSKKVCVVFLMSLKIRNKLDLEMI